MTIDELYARIQQRIKEKPDGSYVAAIVEEGEDRVIQKVGEEAVEVVIAAKNENRKKFIEETADLLFMLTVLLAVKNIAPAEIFGELKQRQKKKIKNTS